MKARIGRFLRTLADRIDYDNAPRVMSYSFRFVERVGIVFEAGHKGCPMMYLPSEYDRAFSDERARG